MSAGSSERETTPLGQRRTAQDDLLLRETVHRCGNDLQLIISMLSLQSRHAINPEVRWALAVAMERVSIVAQSRTMLHRGHQTTLRAALASLCAALRVHADPRGIAICQDEVRDVDGLSETQIATLALVVNELATNAIKHAFHEDGPGMIRLSAINDASGGVTIVVDDDGAPFPDTADARLRSGLGMELVRRLTVSAGGLFIGPAAGAKNFELRVPRYAR